MSDTLARLASRLRHDLRGPLLSIKMGLEILEIKEDQAALLNSMLEPVSRAEGLVSNLVELAAMFAPRAEARRLGPVLNQVASETEVEVEADPEARAQVDADHLMVVLRHLIASSGAAGAERVRLRCFTEERIVVEVEDSGPGFESSELDNEGFGLAIAKASLTAHGGRLIIGRSSEFEGASVRLRISRITRLGCGRRNRIQKITARSVPDLPDRAADSKPPAAL